MKKLIVIADWAHDTLNCQELRSVIEGFVKDPTFVNIGFVQASPSTIHTAFLVSQVVQTEERYGRPQETVIFQNTDPRLQSVEGVNNAKGAEFIIARLKSGIFVCGPNAGYNFSLIKKDIDALYHYDGLSEGSQFRSRDLYSRICAHLMDEMEDELELEESSSDAIPELRGYYIVHIDNHGNLKTSIDHEKFKGKYEHGDLVSIKINKVERKARYVTNLFGGAPGELVIYPGSSGIKDNPYLEISIWRHFTEENPTTGLHTFNYPKPGQQVELRS